MKKYLYILILFLHSFSLHADDDSTFWCAKLLDIFQRFQLSSEDSSAEDQEVQALDSVDVKGLVHVQKEILTSTEVMAALMYLKTNEGLKNADLLRHVLKYRPSQKLSREQKDELAAAAHSIFDTFSGLIKYPFLIKMVGLEGVYLPHEIEELKNLSLNLILRLNSTSF